jgi:hypothetical protein
MEPMRMLAGSVLLYFTFSPTALLASTIRGQVTTGYTTPIVGAMVLLSYVNVQAPPTDTVYTDSLGQYFFNNLGGGYYGLNVIAMGYYPSSMSFSFNDGHSSFVADNINLTAISSSVTGSLARTRFHLAQIGGRTVVEFGNTPAKWVEVYSLKGALLHRVSTTTGVTRVELPAEITPTNMILLRLR